MPRTTRIPLLALAALFAGPAAFAVDYPTLKPGQWEMTTTTDRPGRRRRRRRSASTPRCRRR